MENPLENLPFTNNSPSASPWEHPLQPGQSVLDGTMTVKQALERDALRGPRPQTRNTWLKRGDELDPVLAHHLRRTHY